MDDNHETTITLVQQFRDHLFNILDCNTQAAARVFDLIIREESYSASNIVETLTTGFIDITRIFTHILNITINTLVIMPCSQYIIDCLEIFQNNFTNLILCDNYKNGNVYNGLTVIDQKAFDLFKGEVDAYFIASGNPKVQKIFMSSVDPKRTVVYSDFAREVYYRRPTDYTRVKVIISRIMAAKQPFVILVRGYYPNVYTPIYSALQDYGYDIFIFSRQSRATHAGYNSPIEEAVPFSEKHVLHFNEMLYLVRHIEKGILWIIEETFFDHAWDLAKTVPSYAYPAAVMRMAKVPTLLNLYDVVRLFSANLKSESQSLSAYKEMLASASGIILGSNTQDSVDFLRSTFTLKQPITKFFRHNFAAQKLQPKLTSGFHIVMVGIFLGEHKDPVRIQMPKHVRSLVRQKIHVHYYTNSPAADFFRRKLGKEYREYFHVHPSILDQQELMYEISQYHAGWMVHDTQGFINIISRAKTQLMRDLIYMFHLTTVPSCILLFGCTGLPIFINRSMQGILREYPSRFFIPIELSEISDLKHKIEETDWESIRAQTEPLRHLFSIEENIPRLIEFIDLFRAERCCSQ